MLTTLASQDGRTALVKAAWSGDKDTAELLLDRGADLGAKDRVSQLRWRFFGADLAWASQAGRGPRW